MKLTQMQESAEIIEIPKGLQIKFSYQENKGSLYSGLIEAQKL